MKTLLQDAFSAPENPTSVESEPIVLHRRPSATNEQLVILVHGLGGSRYGNSSTWADFPKFLFEQVADVDIGMYQYTSGLSRWRFWDSISLETEAQIFSDLIRDGLSGYKKIILVGHSMGGLLCKATIAALIDKNDSAALARLGGMILMATPQLGSKRAPGVLGFLSPDLQVLHAHSDFITRINATLENHVAFTEAAGDFDKVFIPAFAVLGASDFWVDRMSAGIGLPASRKKMGRGSHTKIVKPVDSSDDIYIWTKDKIRACLRPFKYDVFVASAMAALRSEEDYTKSRADALSIIAALKASCGFESIFYAGIDLETKSAFEAQSIALKEDVLALKQSRYFLLIYPERIVSSVLFEAGLALAMGKPSIYLARRRDDLPFLMKEASQAKIAANVTIYERPDIGAMVELITEHGEALWGADAFTSD